jgi:glutathione S-transferase
MKVNPYHKPESLLKLNPRGLVPTLQYDNKPLYESTVICEFLEEAFPDHGPKLLSEDPYERARTRIWTDYCTSRIIPAFHRFLQFQPMSNTEGLEEVRKEFLGHLKEFTKEMDPEGPYFSGKDVGLIDLVVAPWAGTYHIVLYLVRLYVILTLFSSPSLGLRPLQEWSQYP